MNFFVCKNWNIYSYIHIDLIFGCFPLGVAAETDMLIESSSNVFASNLSLQLNLLKTS